MKARDIMTMPVFTIAPDTQVRDIAELLIERRISGVPVVENGRLIGFVSEGDLLRRPELGTDSYRATGGWWLRLFRGDPSSAQYVKSHARRARDIMTRDVITVGEDTPVAEIANLLATRRMKRVPVLRGEEMVGIISRADLVRMLAAKPRAGNAARPKGDVGIRRRLLAELERQPWWRTDMSHFTVADGVVHFWGLFDSQDEANAARVAAENVSGVRKVEDHRRLYSEMSWAI
jgi:CBS domain-containing protein